MDLEENKPSVSINDCALVGHQIKSENRIIACDHEMRNLHASSIRAQQGRTNVHAATRLELANENKPILRHVSKPPRIGGADCSCYARLVRLLVSSAENKMNQSTQGSFRFLAIIFGTHSQLLSHEHAGANDA